MEGGRDVVSLVVGGDDAGDLSTLIGDGDFGSETTLPLGSVTVPTMVPKP